MCELAMKLSGVDYMTAAVERIEGAQLMYRHAQFVEALYLSGVAVECALRALARDSQSRFDGRHDLPLLARAAGLDQVVGGKKRQEISRALNEVWVRWKNNYRYASERRLRNEIKRLALDRSVRGDTLKENARRALVNAAIVLNEGILRWNEK